jgi:hypothetical protein
MVLAPHLKTFHLTMRRPEAFLAGLPPELRLPIYDYLVREDRVILSDRTMRARRRFHFIGIPMLKKRLSAIRCCSRLYRDEIKSRYPTLLQMFLRDNAFSFRGIKHLTTFAGEAINQPLRDRSRFPPPPARYGWTMWDLAMVGDLPLVPPPIHVDNLQHVTKIYIDSQSLQEREGRALMCW